jgi:diguanylate cyclase (GGDEF)-like protein
VLGILLVGMLALGLVALRGLGQGHDTNRGLSTAVEETGLDVGTRADLMDFKGKLTLFIATSDRAQMRGLRGEIEQLLARIDRRFAEMHSRYVARPADLRLTVAQESRYRELVRLWRSGVTEITGAGAAVDRRKADMVERVRRQIRPMSRAGRQLQQRDVMLAQNATRAAAASYTSTRRMVLVALLGLFAVGVGLAVWLIRGVVPRTRRYAHFASDVSAGDLSTRIAVEGQDELAELGHTLNTMVAQREAEREHGESQDELTDALQVAADEEEAHGMLKLHLERRVPGSSVVVLNRNNREVRLDAKTPVEEGSPLAERLDGAVPRDCLAVRFARPHRAGGGRREPLLTCRICGEVPGASTCDPLLVGGEVIGSVLVNTPEPLDDQGQLRLTDSVVQAAPVLANLRNLAIAEIRASTDSLTGLPNSRSVRDTVKRLVAHSSRSKASLALALLDLDHFKQINDTFGHGRGDDVLAAVGSLLSGGVRESDFVGRMGGEEFVIALPDTDREGALVLCEKLRAGMTGLEIPGVDRTITISVGVALVPDHAGTAEEVLRAADRALYTAKEQGRDQVMLATPSDAMLRRTAAGAGV